MLSGPAPSPPSPRSLVILTIAGSTRVPSDRTTPTLDSAALLGAKRAMPRHADDAGARYEPPLSTLFVAASVFVVALVATPTALPRNSTTYALTAPSDA
jgi:hypothetical protein